MTNRSKRIGDAAELEISRILSDLLNIRIRRKLGAGRNDDEGDIEGLADCTVEVKNYPRTGVAAAINEALDELEREQVNAATTFGVAFIKRPRKGWIAVQTPEQWATLYREATGP